MEAIEAITNRREGYRWLTDDANTKFPKYLPQGHNVHDFGSYHLNHNYIKMEVQIIIAVSNNPKLYNCTHCYINHRSKMDVSAGKVGWQTIPKHEAQRIN